MNWLVGRFRSAQELQDAGGTVSSMVDWIKSLGLDPTYMLICAAVVQESDGGFVLHLSEQVRSGHSIRIDVARDQVASTPVSVPIEPDSWPKWLTGVHGFGTRVPGS